MHYGLQVGRRSRSPPSDSAREGQQTGSQYSMEAAPNSPLRRPAAVIATSEARSNPHPLALGQEIASLALAMTLRVSFAACGGGVRRLRQAPNRSRSAP